MTSGTRKSAVYKEVTAPIIEMERAAAIEAQHAADVAAIEKEEMAVRLTQMTKDVARGDADPAELRDLKLELRERHAPVIPRYFVDDVTSEKLEVLLAEQGGRIAVFSPEGDLFDNMAGRYDQNGNANFAVFLKGHAGDALRTDRITRSSVQIDRPALTVGVAVQPSVIEGLAAKSSFRGRGLTPRFLYALPESNVGRRDINPQPLSPHLRDHYHARIIGLYGAATGGLVVLELDEEATGTFNRFRQENEDALAPGEELSDIVEWGAKLPGAVARLAAIIHVARDPENANVGRPIPGSTMDAAIALGGYFTAHSRAAFALMGSDPVMADARYILDHVKAKQLWAFSKRDLFEATKGRFKRVDRLDGPLNVLFEHKYLTRVVSPGRDGPGRPPSPMIIANPHFSLLHSHNSHK